MALPDTVPYIGWSWDDLAFLALAGVMLGAALLVVLGRDIIRSGLWLVLSFAGLAGIYALLGSTLLAVAQVLVYIGAISVLILFAIMLTQAGDANLPSPFHRQVWLAAVAALVVVGLIGWAVTATDWGNATVVVGIVLDTMAAAIFTDYALPFEILSLLLLVAIIGAIYLARRPEDDERANS